jgi:hypothetical protein
MTLRSIYSQDGGVQSWLLLLVHENFILYQFPDNMFCMCLSYFRNIADPMCLSPHFQLLCIVCRNIADPMCLSPHFRLVRICEQRQSKGDLGNIDALLGEL